MPKIISFIIVFAYIVYFFLTPPFTIHDEPAHVEIVVGVAQGKYIDMGLNDTGNKQLEANKRLQDALRFEDHPYQIPTFGTVSSLQEQENDYNLENIFSHQAYSPPVYYSVGAGFYYLSKLTENLLGQFYIMRLTSAVFYFATVFIAWKILQIFFTNKKTASAVLLLFSLNPLVLKMGIGVNPDIAVTFFSLCVLFYVLKYSTTLLKFRHIVTISLFSVLAAMTKMSGIFTNVFFMIYLLVTQGFNRKTLQSIILFQSIFFILTAPWFFFAFQRYNTFFPESFSLVCAKSGIEPSLASFIDAFTAFRFTIMNYAGFMGQGWPYPFDWFFISYVLLFCFFLVVGVYFVWHQKKKIYQTLLLYVVPLGLLLTVLSAQFRIKQIDCDIQGRYLMPVFFILSLFVYWGIFTFTKSEKKAAQIVSAFAIFHYLFILFTVLFIRYYV